MTSRDWIRDAVCDDSLVAEALICLHHSEPPPPPHEKSGASDLKFKWSVRQRRSKAVTSRKKGDHTRSSPTTPLSWSGATSVSGGGGPAVVDGFDDSNAVKKLSESVRSKISQTSVTITTTTTPFKRPRKKKTLVELREEESLLLKERKGLQNELASLRLLLNQQRTRNMSLKKQLQGESQKNDDSSFFLLPDLNIPLDNIDL